MKCKGIETSTNDFIEIQGDSVISHVDPVLEAADNASHENTTWISPGFVDLQVNGFAGVDYNSPSSPLEEIARSVRAMFSTGVTRFFPTVITGSPEDMLGALRNLARARATLPEGPAMEAFHVEGPHISPHDGPRGAHPARWVRPPDVEEFRRWQDAAQGNVRLVTLSPEWPGSTAYIEQLAREGVVSSIGHTRATRDQIADAVRAGATLSTHLGNGADAVLPRHPNYIWEQLAEDKLAASFIVDGHHLPESFLRVALRAKGIERSILVTDAVMPALCAPGDYRLGEVDVELKDDQRVVLRGGTRLAGSSLRMDAAISNVMRIAGLTLTEAIAMATVNPARVGRIGGRVRGLRAGDRSDVVRFRVEEGRLRVIETFMSGERVFSARSV
ncbi:MAG TPA: amidohydrolase family protein [Bryobacteraceae bacterium]|jgi:N-acetylglucosamine-6-phosphate deacetylase|nr:amidohydrolase family protein [Bryobacteraceae bacterium]